MNTTAARINAVEVRDLEKRFGRFTAVNRVSFDVQRGRIFGFIGPNGAGKSTTIRMLCGIIAPTSGTGAVNGFDIRTEQKKIKHHIGYMSQKFSLYEDLTVEENIDFYAGIYELPSNKKKQRKEWIVRMAGLERLRSSLTRTLSTGWKQRLALGCAIIHEPPILFLDEPTSGVDPISRKNFWDLIRTMAGGGATIFVTTHYMDEAENCDSMALIYKGDIIAIGTPSQLKTDFMRGDVLKIAIPDSQQWLERLRVLPDVIDAALFGADIHAVVFDATKAFDAFKRFFDGNTTARYEINEISPSLEDVFVSLIQDYDSRSENDEHQKS